MEITSTNKGKPVAHFNGFAYREFRRKPDGLIVWRCQKERSTRCRGMLKSLNGEVMDVNDHSCGAPDAAQLEVMTRINQAKKRAREEDTSISKIYKEELGELHNKGYNFVTEMPHQLSAKRTLYGQRRKARGTQTEPKTREDIVLDEEMRRMKNGSNFVLVDEGSEERMIIFCSEKGKESLKTTTEFFMDGTFKSCSKQFGQLYTIHADYGSSETETNVHPVVFGLLPNKMKASYVKLFRSILEAVPEWNPRIIHIDFEMSAISAIREVLPLCEIYGCYFHFRQCLWRKVQEIGLVMEYKDNAEVRLTIQMCAAVAFLKTEDVHDGWVEIHSQAPENPKLSIFFDYFVEQWLDNESIPIEMWNCHGRQHRTTNAVEGWHHKINNLLGRPNPKIRDVVLCLKSEAEESACMYMRMEMNLAGKKRKKTYVDLDRKLERAVKKYEENGDLMTCLKTISYVQKLV